jgi:16S rRNA (cytidine1402-2'-O)-methyltransferase
MVFFEAPHRVAEMLADAASVLGQQRPAAVCRELTKTYEEVRRGGLAELATWAAEGVLGEITVVVAGLPASDRLPLSDAVDEVRQRVADGEKRSAAAAAVAAATGHDRRELYDGSRA